MFISPKYTWSDRLQAGLSCRSLLLIIGVSFGAIFMSVNIVERSTFGKELFALINVCSQMYEGDSICNEIALITPPTH